MSESNEAPTEELTEEDIEAIAASFAEGNPPALTHTLLEIWRNILSNIESAREERIPPVIANRVVTAYPKIEYHMVPQYWDTYYDLLTEMRDILDDVIASDNEAFDRVEDDAILNRDLYVEVLFGWSDKINQWEEEWDTMSPNAAVELAAIADVSSVIVGETGLTENLSQLQIGFSFDDSDRIALQERLAEAAAGRA